MSEQRFSSPKDAKAQASAAKAYRKASRPWFKKKRFWVLGALVLLIIVIAASSGGDDDATPTNAPSATSTEAPAATESAAPAEPTEPEFEDATVVVDSCEPGEFDTVNGSVTLTNTADESRSYLITVSANGPDGNRLAELSGAANAIAAGQSASIDLIGSITDAPDTLTCVVANVTSLPS